LARQKIATAIANENTSREKDENTRVQGQVASLEGIKDLQDKVSSISKNFSKDEADVFQQGKNVIVRLRGIKFKVNKAEIPSSSYATLKKVQDSIESLDSSTVIIEGHTDSTGSPSINMPLSKQRAESVRNYMAANLASNNIEVQTEGYGATKPLSSNKTPQGRAVNRRIDVVIQAR
jgi:OOP family OmpA-OmpF porin